MSGIYRDILLVRAADDTVYDNGQDGGLVSAILIWCLENNIIDGALVSMLDGDAAGWKAVPGVATTRDEVLSAAGSRYTYSANTIAYDQARERGLESLALVGMSCQTSVAPVMWHRRVGKVSKPIKLNIGLLCSKSFDDALFDELFWTKYRLAKDDIVKMNIKGVFQVWMRNGDYHEIPLKECHAWTRDGCNHCPDFAAEHADISTGGIGNETDWTLTIVRTDLGRAIIDAMLDRRCDRDPPRRRRPGRRCTHAPPRQEEPGTLADVGTGRSARRDFVSSLDAVADAVADCRRCPRLVQWRELIANEKRAAFADEDYWGRGVAGFGDPEARLMVVGLAPAAHGANRTGRMFTGDRSGDWLYRALWRAGFANQPRKRVGRRRPGAERGLGDLTGQVRPAGQPARRRARSPTVGPTSPRNSRQLRPRVLVALGSVGFASVARHFDLRPRPRFGHGAVVPIDDDDDPSRLLSRQPAEHLHGPTDRGDARRRLQPRPEPARRVRRMTAARRPRRSHPKRRCRALVATAGTSTRPAEGPRPPGAHQASS